MLPLQPSRRNNKEQVRGGADKASALGVGQKTNLL